MAVTAKLYGQFLKEAISSGLNLATDTIKVMLCTSAYVPDQDNHIDLSHITNEVTGAGYTAGGATLAGKSVAYDPVANVVKFDAEDTAWAASSITARYAVIYDATISKLIAYVDFGENMVSSNNNFKLTWPANGIFYINVV